MGYLLVRGILGRNFRDSVRMVDLEFLFRGEFRVVVFSFGLEL